MNRHNNHKKSLLKRLGVAAFVSAGFLMGATYILLALFFKDHFYCGTTINGIDYSYKTPVEAGEILYDLQKDYVLEITGREEISDSILPAEIGLEYTFEDFLVQVKREQNPWIWLGGFFYEHRYQIPKMAEFDEKLLKEKIKNLSFFNKDNIRQASDASLEYSNTQKKYIVLEGSPGTLLDREKTKTVIQNAVSGLNRAVDLEQMECYRNAAVLEDSTLLQHAADQANSYLLAEIIYDWNGTEIMVNDEIITGWLEIKEKKIILNEELIKEFVSKQASQYDTYGKNRFFRTTDGRELELKSGAYGWKTDKEAETAALIEHVKKGDRLSKTPVYTNVGAKSGKKDMGTSYVEIDLGKQHLYLYKDGVVVLESDFVSGNASRGWNTPAGIFGLTYKTRDAVLRGETYETPVSYWMPFNGNIGMHDANWRSNFGGDIYLTNGSHGCVNLPPENAKIIYDYIYTGFPVVCYY